MESLSSPGAEPEGCIYRSSWLQAGDGRCRRLAMVPVVVLVFAAGGDDGGACRRPGRGDRRHCAVYSCIHL